MSKLPQKTKLIIKRYGLPILITLVIYTALYFLCGKGVPYVNKGLWIALLYACLMRFCDDVNDYEEDVKLGKAPIEKDILTWGVMVAVFVIVLLSMIGAFWWLILPLVLIELLLILKGLAADIIKPFFTPAVIITLTICVFEINIFTWILSVVLMIADGVLVFRRRK